MILTIGILSLIACIVITAFWLYVLYVKNKRENFIVTLTMLSGCAVLLLPIISVLTGICALIAFFWTMKGH
jgi:hypothetical protein